MRAVLGLLAGLVATAAAAQTGWQPPMEQPATLRDARVVAPAGAPVPIFRDGATAVDAWFAGGMVSDGFSDPIRARAACFAPHDARITVSRVFRDDEKSLFAIVNLPGRQGCTGVIFHRYIRLDAP